MGEPRRILGVTELPVEQVLMRDRLRPISDAGAEAVAASIRELGIMKDPIHVRRVKRSGEHVLIAGAHRLSAATLLGWETVPVVLWECTDEWAEILEMDDNLAGANLTPLDTAVFMARRKELYERAHPETKRGIAGALGRWDANDRSAVASFAAVTAETFDLTERHVQRLVAAGGSLSREEVDALRGAPRQLTLADLQALSKIGEPDERAHVVTELAEGRQRSAAKARKAFAARRRGEEPRRERTSAEIAEDRLRDAWERATVPMRHRLIREHRDQIAELLNLPLAADDPHQ